MKFYFKMNINISK